MEKLYARMEEILKTQGIMRLYACVVVFPIEDETLTHTNVHYHEREGYRIVEAFPTCGFKFGRWYDMVRMEKGYKTPHSSAAVAILCRGGVYCHVGCKNDKI